MYSSLSLREIRVFLAKDHDTTTEQEIALLCSDSRLGVQKLGARLRDKQKKAEKRAAEDSAMLNMEKSLWGLGYRRVLGMDEVGRGSLAGPVTVAGVILSPGAELPGVRDSKVLSASQRNSLYSIIQSGSLGLAVASRDESFIDSNGIAAAVKSCQCEIVAKLSPDYLLLDAFPLPEVATPQTAIEKGDSKSVSIAAASIVAKIARDAFMTEVHDSFRDFNFASNKGYGSKEHRQALLKHGACALHRRSFLGSLFGTHA